ncbi:putative MO25-like protein At5g47540 isoform X2 [Ananas comosus]|uniref:MO25-like protein At5g47540 isoform X2 n=1 Tax=Ananas comosus TaxID=4615 RepID=A0A6P5GDJ7_ANACO|nr:putative MO25-like protein At5g47540 isoform X2 [Ananas comosus]
MRGLFRSKPRPPADVVRHTRDLLAYVDRKWDSREAKREEKMAELSKNIRELKFILYGSSEADPVPEACAQLTQEFFRENTLRLLILCLPKLNLETRKDATQIVANLQRQQVHSRLIASDYLEANKDLLDILVAGYDNIDVALHYGAMLRECIRHQCVARYILESEHMKKFFDYIQNQNFDIESEAFATFKLLGDMLLDRSNSAVMVRYVSSMDYLRVLMGLLTDESMTIRIEAFHVIKLFIANQNKPREIVFILAKNKEKLLRHIEEIKMEKGNDQFEADKSQVIQEIAGL